jgi:hypothetical protein
MIISNRGLALLPVTALLAFNSAAHHNFATHYDSTSIVEITGTLTSVEIRSPHSFFMVDVESSDGPVQAWEVEGHATALMRREGITDDTFRVGDVVTISGPRGRRSDKNLMFGANLHAADGRVIHTMNALTRGAKDRVADSRTGITGLQRFAGRYLGTTGRGQRIADTPMKLNEAGSAARAAFDVYDTPGMNCIAPNLPSIFYPPYMFDIRVEGDNVVLHHEYYDVERPFIAGADQEVISPPNFGSRRGHLDGDILVIESSGFPAMLAGLAGNLDSNGNGADIPSSVQKSIVERYTLSKDGSELSINYTVSDPVYLAEPYTDTVSYFRVSPNTPMYDFPCDRDISLRSTKNASLPD